MSHAIDCVEDLEQCRERFPVLSKLSKTLVRALRIGLHTAPGHPVMKDLNATILCLGDQLRRLKAQQPNHFGGFKDTLYLSAIAAVSARLELLLTECEGPSDDMDYVMADTDVLISSVLAKTFWIKYCGPSGVEISVEEFTIAFETEFGPQPRLLLVPRVLLTRPLGTDRSLVCLWRAGGGGLD
jgi:hypothetical protein